MLYLVVKWIARIQIYLGIPLVTKVITKSVGVSVPNNGTCYIWDAKLNNIKQVDILTIKRLCAKQLC
jgi:hypothetical protein